MNLRFGNSGFGIRHIFESFSGLSDSGLDTTHDTRASSAGVKSQVYYNIRLYNTY